MSTAATSARQSLWAVRVAAGEPAAVVRVRNLQASIEGAATGADTEADTVPDGWGRGGRAQPLLVSAEAQLARGFQEAAASDSVAADTVHYGSLSKAILGVFNEAPREGTLYDVMDAVWVRLTGRRLGAAQTEALKESAALLAPPHVRALTVTLHLPKAALVGDGVSLTASGLLGPDTGGVHAVQLELHGLRVPVLVGVHPHERRARQTVVARVAVDLLGGSGSDRFLQKYPELTQHVVDVLVTSAYETLEALAATAAEAVLAWAGGGAEEEAARRWYRVHVALEKPMAVPFADAPEVMVVVGGTDRV